MTETLHPAHVAPSRPTTVRSVRDEMFRVLALVLGRVLLPAAWLRSPRGARARAARWALRIRFPHESLDGLTAGLSAALDRARTETFWEHDLLLGVTSGHRSVQEQRRLMTADRLRLESVGIGPARVLPVEESRHVAGLAVDVRPHEAAEWLEHNGYRFDLYRTYANEWWHFEYLPQTRGIAPQVLAHPGAGRR